MVLEATMICIDNSEWMRNGDYSPNRFQSQAEAVNLICGSKTQLHPENTVGVLTSAGKGVRVLVTPTTDLGKILACMHGIELGGESKLTAAVQIAHLALKHRQNKNQRQRIVLFAGSPVTADKKVLESIGKKLKKNNVALDIVNFGEEDAQKAEKLEALFSAVNSNDNSHIVHAHPAFQALSDILMSSPIFNAEGGEFAASAAASAAVAAATAAGTGGFEFGVDPNLDPELALALRVSMEEERARQEAAARKASEDMSVDASQSQAESSRAAVPDVTMTDAPVAPAAAAASTEKTPDVTMDDESFLLAQALAMSMGDGASGSGGDANMAEADQDLAEALQMSMLPEATNNSGNDGDVTKVLGDAAFVNQILSSLPGVDPNDPSVRDVLAALETDQEEKNKNDSSKSSSNREN